MKAVVISLEAPLFLTKSLTATIIQRARKGDRLYIHNDEFGSSQNQEDFSTKQYFSTPDELFDLYNNPLNYDDSNRIIQYMQPESFYKTLSKNGTTAYIQGKHIKIIYEDRRELYDNTQYPTRDVTDYRLAEPIPDKYPFYSSGRRRLLTSFGMAPGSATNYVYNQPLNSEVSSRRYTGAISYTKNIDLDTTNRIYFGGSMVWSSEKKDFTLPTGQAEELKAVISIGPYMSYDFFRKENYYFTVFGNVLLSYDRSFITVSAARGTEQRIFNGFYTTLRSGLLFTYRHLFIPNLQLFMGSDLQLNPSYSLRASDPVIPTNWNLSTADKVSYPTGGYINIFIGLKIFY